MQTGSQWYDRIATEISQYQYTLGQKEANKQYKLDLLLRVAGRVDSFSDICSECQTFKQEITSLVQEMSLLIQMPSKQGIRNHTKAVDRMVEHLKKVHKLVDKGHYMGMGVGIGLAIGAGIGAALGSVFDNAGIGTGIGIVLGIIVGTYLDRKAKEEGRVI
jgi:hypothetical protein